MAPRHDRVSSRFRLRLWALVASPLIGVAAAAILAHGQGKRIAFLLIALPPLLALAGSVLAHGPVRMALGLATGAALVGVACFLVLLVLAGLSGALS